MSDLIDAKTKDTVVEKCQGGIKQFLPLSCRLQTNTLLPLGFE